MSGVPSTRLVAGAVAAHLAGVTNATGYYGQIGRPLPGQKLIGQPGGTIHADPPPKSDEDRRVTPYFVLYPSNPGPGVDPNAGGCETGSTLAFSITAAAGDIDDLLALVDRIDARINRWTPTVPGVACGRVTHPIGYVPSTVLVDRDLKPVRLYTAIPYVLAATT